MARQIIGVGTGPDTHTGEPLRTAWVKTNENFAELYSTTANLANLSANTGNIVFSAQTISGQLANTNITIQPLGVGQVNIVGNLTTSQLRFMGNTISTQFDGDLVLESSAGNIKLNDPIKFPDGTVQYSAAVGNAGTVNTLTITNAVIATLTATAANITGNIVSGNIKSSGYYFANNNSILANISTVGFTGSYNDLTNKPSIPTVPTAVSSFTNDSGYITSAYVTWSNVSAKPTFATVATSGSYPDLLNRPSFANVSTTGDYNDLTNTPNLSVYATTTYVNSTISNLVANAPSTLDTLREITDSLGNLTSIVDYVDNSVANAVPDLSSYSGNIIPSANVTYSLGNSTNRWSDLWLSGNTIQLGNLSLSASANGLTSTSGFDLANSTAANIEATGNITASDMYADRIYANIGVETPQVQFTDTVSGNGVNLLNNGGFIVYESNLGSAGGFVPSADDSESIGQSDRRWATVYANAFIGDGSQLSNVASTGNLDITGTLIEIAAGAPETSIVISPSGPTGGQAFVDVPDNTTANTANLRIYNSLGNIELGTNSGNSSWYFGSDGNLIIPGEIQGIEGTAGGVANIRGGFGTAGPGGDVYVVGGASGNGSSEFGNVIVGAGVGAWTFDNTGVLTVPGTVQPVTGNDLDIKGSSDNLGVYIFAHGTDGLANGAAEIDITANGVTVYSAYGENSPGSPNVKWTFAQDGNLTVPGAIRGEGNSTVISANSQNWTFANTGNLTVPGSVNLSSNGVVSFTSGSTLSFGDVPVTNRYYVDATRTDTYTQNGSQSRPFTTIAAAQAAIATAISGGLNPQVTPVFIILLSNITENVTLATNHVYLIGQNGQIHQPIILTGNVTINPTSGTLNTNHFSITGLEIVGGTDGKAIYVTGTSPLRLSLQDVWITANGNNGAGLYQDNSGSGTYTHGGPVKVSHNGTGDVYCFNIVNGSASFDTVETSGATQVGAAQAGTTLTFNNSQLEANGDVVLETYGTGVLVVTNSLIKNSAANSYGIKLNSVANVAGTVSVGQSAFNVPLGTGSAVWLDPNTTPGLSGTFAFGGASFYPGKNSTTSATLIPGPIATLVGTMVSPIFYGDITSYAVAQDWDLIDNNASALSFDTTGKAGILELVTTNSAEGVKMSGFANIVGNITGGNISTAGNITGNTAGYTIGYRDIPQVSLTGNVTLAATDGGKHYYSANATAILTIPNNTSTSFSIGTAVTVIQQGSASITITPDTGVTLYMAGNSTSSTRTLSNYGMATLMKVATNTWFINGTGVS